NLSPSNSYRYPWTIVVIAKGFGLVWHNFTSTSEHDLRLVMGRETRLRGRLLDSSGKPAAGIRVQVERFADVYDPHHRGDGPKDKLELWSTRLPVAAIADPEGRFDLHGLPKMPSISIVTSGARFARTFFECATIETSEIDRLNSAEASQAHK